MRNIKIFTIILFIVNIFLAYYLINSIRSSIAEEERINDSENAIIDKLNVIRDLELSYLSINGRYAGTWEELYQFIDSANFYLTEKIEKVTILSYGKEEIEVTIDTLGSISVYDSLFAEGAKYNAFNVEELKYVPYVNPKTPFDLWAGTTVKSGLTVNVVEVKNPSPIDPDRKESSPYNTRKPLRFGSKNSVTTSGNWE